MKFYITVENETGRIRSVHSIGDNVDIPELPGMASIEINQDALEVLKNRDWKTTNAFWDFENGEVLIQDKDQSVLTGRAWDALRTRRNKLLADTDKTQLPDFPNGSLYVDYRQTLRDLPQNTTDPFNPVWPELPETARLYLSGGASAQALKASAQALEASTK